MKSSPMQEAGRLLHFGLFEMHPVSGELRKQGMKIHIPSQAAKVLLVLLESPGEMRTREELKRRLWPQSAFGDFDHGLNKCIHILRTALGDHPQSPRFIETLAGRGYRFIGSGHSQWHGERRTARSWKRTPLAVLPFAAAEGQPDLSFLGGQIASHVIDGLSAIPGLKVLAFSEVRAALSTDTVHSLRSRLVARAFILGDLHRHNNDLYIHAEMVDSEKGTQFWGMHYKTMLHHDADLAEPVAEKIIQHVHLLLASGVHGISTVS